MRIDAIAAVLEAYLADEDDDEQAFANIERQLSRDPLRTLGVRAAWRQLLEGPPAADLVELVESYANRDVGEDPERARQWLQEAYRKLDGLWTRVDGP